MTDDEWRAARGPALQILLHRAEDTFREVSGEIARRQSYGEDLDPRLFKLKLDAVTVMARLLEQGVPKTTEDPEPEAQGLPESELRARVAELLKA